MTAGNTKIIKKGFWRNLIIFLSLLGPGLITGSVDNDAGGITTYSIAGALYGYNLLWTMIPAFIVLVVIQEMNARMGIVTGKGLADLIRENSGAKITFLIFMGFLFADIGNTTTEFAGVAGSMEVFGVSKYLSVPIVGVAVWLLAVKGTYRIVEKVFLVFSLFLFIYVISAILGKPDWSEIGMAMVNPEMEFSTGYIAITVGIVGTTIAPWMQFYMQSAVIEKGLKIEDYKYTIWDVVIGSVATVVIAFFIIVACGSTLHPNNVTITEAKDAAMALEPLAGQLSSSIFALGLFVASVFSATILPLTTSFYICEAFGFEAGVDKRWDEAPEFYTIYTGIIIIGASIILIPNAPLIVITLYSQIINGLFLPVVLLFMMNLINKKEVMGNYTNSKPKNAIGWTAVVLLIILSATMLVLMGMDWVNRLIS